MKDITYIQNKKHRKIFEQLITQNKNKEDLILGEYDKFKKYKVLMKNNNIDFESFFEDEISFKSFENFSDKVANTVILNNAKKLKKSVLNNKYKHLENKKTDELFLLLAENNVQKETIKEFIGKKIISFQNKTAEEFNNSLGEFVETLISWDINKYKNNKIKNPEDLLEIDDVNKTLLIDMNSMDKVNQYGSDMWCIKREEHYYKEYTSEGLRFYNLLDFNKDANDKKSQIALVVNFQGNVTDAYFKNDDNAYSYVMDELKEYNFKEMNIEEIVEYLDRNNAIDDERIVRTFINKNHSEVMDDFFIAIEDEPEDEDYDIDQLFLYGYDVWELQMFGREKMIELTTFINTNKHNSENVLELFINNENKDKDMFFTHCLFKKLNNDRTFTAKNLIELTEEYAEKTQGKLEDILFNDELFSLHTDHKKEIFDELKKQSKYGNFEDTSNILYNSPLENSDIVIDYLSSNSKWDEHKEQFLKQIKSNRSSEHLNENKGIVHLINSNEFETLDTGSVILSFLRNDEFINKDNGVNIKDKVVDRIKNNKDEFEYYFKNPDRYLKYIGDDRYNRYQDFNQISEINALYDTTEIHAFLKEKLLEKKIIVKDSKHMESFFEKEKDKDLRENYLFALIHYDMRKDNKQDTFFSYNEQVEKKMLEEDSSTLTNIIKRLEMSYCSPKAEWKRDLITAKIKKELKSKLKIQNRNQLKNAKII